MLVPVLQEDWTIILRNPEFEDVTNYLDTVTEANKNDDIEQPNEANKIEVAEFKAKVTKN
jgi:hypothetical protein